MSGDWHKIGNVRGADGVGVPRGGARGDVLKKEGGADHATSWGKVNYADIEGKVPAAALPEISLEPYVVDSEAAMLNLPAVPGRQAIRTDIGATFVLAQEPASELENWVEMVSRSDVTSVNSKTGAVVLTKADLGLGNVDNTADSDKPLATTTVPGLMPHTDKVKLNNATASATASRLVMRDSSGRFNIQPPTSGSHPTTKTYVDDEVNRLVAGRTPLSGSAMRANWNGLGTTSQAAVVEGFPIGAPAGINKSAYIGGLGPSNYFVEDPVWEMRHEALGLSYRKQTVRLLACDPAYMVGFAWERIYNPATGKWTDWACIAGDTGWIPSVPSTSTWKNVRSAPFVYKPANLYGQNEDNRPFLRRTPHAVAIQGVFTVNESQAAALAGASYNNMPTFGWVPTYDRGNSGGGIWGPHKDYVNGRPIGVMTGSHSNTWSAYFATPTGTQNTDIGGYRYGPGEPAAKPFLPIRATWDPPQVMTWEGYSGAPNPL